MRKFAVVLSGCGVGDGSEIQEAVLSLLAIAKAGAYYQCLAPNIKQHTVVNHLTGQPMDQVARNVLQEAARIARGKIIDIATADPAQYDAVIFPGGCGVTENLTNFAEQGINHTVEPAVLKFAKAMASTGKPAGFICIAPLLISQIYGSKVCLTIGNNLQNIQAVIAMGGQPVDCLVDDIVVDPLHNKVVTTPAYLLAKSILEAHLGIEKLVQAVMQMLN